VVDEQLAAEYRLLAADSIARFGGRYVIRSGAIVNVEGERPPQQRIVVLEFPTLKHAHDWYGSPEYAPARKLRATALKRRLTFVEGVPARNLDDACKSPDTTSVKEIYHAEGVVREMRPQLGRPPDGRNGRDRMPRVRGGLLQYRSHPRCPVPLQRKPPTGSRTGSRNRSRG